MFGKPSAVVAGTVFVCAGAAIAFADGVGAGDAAGWVGVITGALSAGSVVGRGAELTTGEGTAPLGAATTSALAGGGDAFVLLAALPCEYETPLRTKGSELAGTPAPGD